MKVELPYVSALAVCKATPDQVRVTTKMDGSKFVGGIEVQFKDEWAEVFRTQPCYDNESDARVALSKFVAKIRKTTPYEGQVWPLENGPVPFGFVVHAGPLGERLLARPKKRKPKGSPFTR